MTIGWYRMLRLSQTENFEQIEAPIEQPESQPELDVQPNVPEQVDDNAAQTFLDNTELQPTEEQVSQVIAEGALDTSNKFSQLVGSLNLDVIGAVMGESVAQSFISSVIDDTLQRVQQQLEAA